MGNETVPNLPISETSSETLRKFQSLLADGSENQDAQEISRQVLRKAIGKLIRERSDLAVQIEDMEEDQRREWRRFLLKLLNVVDSLDRMIRLSDPENEMRDSVIAMRTQFTQILEDQDVSPVELSIGDIFDAETCEVSNRQNRSDLTPNTILSIERRGYLWQSKTLRRARVTISIT